MAFARNLERLIAVVALFGVLLGIARGGGRYVYCPAMELVLAEPCCGGEAASDTEADGGDVLDLPDCCVGRTARTVPPGWGAIAPAVVAAPLVAVLPRTGLALDARRSAAGSLPRGPEPPRPRSAARLRAERMVFLN